MKKLSAIPISVATLCVAVQLSSAQAITFDGTTAESSQLRSNVSFSEVLTVPYAKPDQRSSYGSAPTQFVEQWQSTDRQSTTPVIIMIHGGCWLNAYAIDHTYAMNSALREAGFEVWALEYRRIGDEGGGWPGTFTDIQTGLNHVAGQYGGDAALAKRDVTLVGHSAGGHLALLAAQQTPELIDRVIGLAAIADLPTYAEGDNGCQQAGKQFMNTADSTAWQAANPASQPPETPVYLFHGEADTIVPQQQSRTYAEYEQVQLRWLAGAGHFDLIDPQSRAWLTILDELQQLSAKN